MNSDSQPVPPSDEIAGPGDNGMDINIITTTQGVLNNLAAMCFLEFLRDTKTFQLILVTEWQCRQGSATHITHGPHIQQVGAVLLTQQRTFIMQSIKSNPWRFCCIHRAVRGAAGVRANSLRVTNTLWSPSSSSPIAVCERSAATISTSAGDAPSITSAI